MSRPEFNPDAFRSTVASLPSDEFAAVRTAGVQQFAAAGFPTLKDEDWKYTDLAAVIDISQRWLDSGAPDADPDADLIRQVQSSIDAAWLVITNGRVNEALSTGFEERGYDVNRTGELEQDFSDPLTGLNSALLFDALKIRVDGDLGDQRPLALLIADTSGDNPVTSQVRVDIELTSGSRARIIEYHVSSGTGEHYSNALLRLHAAEGAAADYVRIQHRSNDDSQTARLNVKLERDAAIRHFGLDLGGRLSRNDLKIDILGSGASAKFDGLYVVGNEQHVDNHTRIEHRVGPAVSNQEYRGILDGHCRAVWNGKAVVHKGADGTDAKQANHNLLLSDGAEIDAKPELEIYADEVKCAHGTTVGQLDDNALFYLRTRGLDKDRARRVLTRAFAASVVDRAPIPELRNLLADRVELRLQAFGQGATS